MFVEGGAASGGPTRTCPGDWICMQEALSIVFLQDSSGEVAAALTESVPPFFLPEKASLCCSEGNWLPANTTLCFSFVCLLASFTEVG